VRSGALVGRRLELSWLRGRLQLASQGYAHLVLVEGEAGIGKTRLVLELLEEARRASATVVRGRCYQHLNLAYLPLRDSLFPLLEQAIAGHDERASDEVFLQRLSADTQEPGPGAETDMAVRSRQLLTLTRLVVDFAKTTPMVVFVDDLDWADDATLDLLRHLLFRFEDDSPPLLLVATTRLDPRTSAADGVAKLHADPRSATLSLHPLSAMEATELARECRPGVSVEGARQLAVASGGNPLLIDALARWSPTAEGAAQALTSAGHPMVSAIEARLHALDASTLELVRVAAVLVPDNTPSTLAAATGMEPAVLRRARTEAIEQGVLVEDGASILFAHPLYAHVARAETPAPMRRVIHAHIASVLLARSHEPDAVGVREIAHHLAEAGEEAEPAIVAEYARRAGDEAMSIAAWGEAAHHYEAAIAAAGSDLDAKALAALHRLAGLSLRGNLELKRAVGHFDAAIESLGGDSDAETIAELEMWRIRCGVGTQELLDVVKNRTRLESLAETVEQTNPALAAEVLVELSQSYWVDGRMDESETAARRAMAVAAACGSHAAHARAATSLSVPQWFRYDLRESLESLEEGAAEAALADEELSRVGGAAFRIPLVMAWLGRLDEAESRAHECCAVSERVQYPLEEGLPLAALALVAVTRGEFDRVEQLAHRALLVQQLSGYHWAAGLFLPALFSAFLARGRYEAAVDALDTWSDSADPMGLSTIALFRRYATALERRIPAEGERLPSLPRTPMVGAEMWAAIHVELARREGAGANARRAHDPWARSSSAAASSWAGSGVWCRGCAASRRTCSATRTKRWRHSNARSRRPSSSERNPSTRARSPISR
jgi:tetratricopeptide (TPR) repeat protein